MKVVKLNESQLIDIVKNVINEQHEKQYMLKIDWKNTPNIAKEKNDFFSVGNNVEYIPKDPSKPVRDTTFVGPYTEEEYQTYKWISKEMDDPKYVEFLNERGITSRDVTKRTWVDANTVNKREPVSVDVGTNQISNPKPGDAGYVPSHKGLESEIEKIAKQVEWEISHTNKGTKEYYLLVGRLNGYNHILEML